MTVFVYVNLFQYTHDQKRTKQSDKQTNKKNKQTNKQKTKQQNQKKKKKNERTNKHYILKGCYKGTK